MVNIISPFIPTEKWSISTPVFAEIWKDDTSKKGVPCPGAQTTLVVYGFISCSCGRGSKLGGKRTATIGHLWYWHVYLGVTIILIHSHVVFECFLIWKKMLIVVYCMPWRWNRDGFSEWMVQTNSLEGSSWSTFLLPRRFCGPVSSFRKDGISEKCLRLNDVWSYWIPICIGSTKWQEANRWKLLSKPISTLPALLDSKTTYNYSWSSHQESKTKTPWCFHGNFQQQFPPSPKHSI